MLGDIKTFKKTINRGAVIRNHHDTPNNRVAAPFIEEFRPNRYKMRRNEMINYILRGIGQFRGYYCKITQQHPDADYRILLLVPGNQPISARSISALYTLTQRAGWLFDNRDNWQPV